MIKERKKGKSARASTRKSRPKGLTLMEPLWAFIPDFSTRAARDKAFKTRNIFVPGIYPFSSNTQKHNGFFIEDIG